MTNTTVDVDNILELQTEEDINRLIQENHLDTNKISDGYHTFKELYDHRIQLFITLCHALQYLDNEVGSTATPWKSKKHDDGSEWDGWFIAGCRNQSDEQITYHLPIEKWDELKVLELEHAPKYDGHTPADVLERLKKI